MYNPVEIQSDQVSIKSIWYINEIGTDYIIILNCAGFFYVKFLTQ